MTSVISRLRSDSTTPAGGAGDGGPMTLLPIGADLLPRETVAVRRGRTIRWVALGVVLLAVVGVVGGYVLASSSRSSAQADLAAAQDQQNSLHAQTKQYDDVVGVKQQATSLQKTIARLMASDTPWAAPVLEAAGVAKGVVATDITLTAADSQGTGTTSTAVTTTPGAIGTMRMQGNAPDKATIAAFADALAKLTGFTTPFVTTVDQGDGGRFSFTLSVDLTPDLRTLAHSRWSATTTGGGK